MLSWLPSYFLHIQINDLENSRSNRSVDLVFKFNERLRPFLRLRTAIENDRPILKARGGKFREDDLESYLDVFDSLSDVYKLNLIDKDAFYNEFSYDLVKAYDNAEVQAYLKDIRTEDPNFYSGFENLAKQMKAVKPNRTPR